MLPEVRPWRKFNSGEGIRTNQFDDDIIYDYLTLARTGEYGSAEKNAAFHLHYNCHNHTITGITTYVETFANLLIQKNLPPTP